MESFEKIIKVNQQLNTLVENLYNLLLRYVPYEELRKAGIVDEIEEAMKPVTIERGGDANGR